MNATLAVQGGALLVAALACCIALVQVRVTRGTRHAELIRQALLLLNSVDLRSARREVYKLAGKPVDDWTADEVAAVEIVGSQFSHLGFMIKHRYVPRRAFMNAWQYRFVRSYAIIEPYLARERIRLELDQHWIYFELHLEHDVAGRPHNAAPALERTTPANKLSVPVAITVACAA
jgi:hypothetical protein